MDRVYPLKDIKTIFSVCEYECFLQPQVHFIMYKNDIYNVLKMSEHLANMVNSDIHTLLGIAGYFEIKGKFQSKGAVT